MTPADRERLFTQGLTLHQRGKIEEAIKYYKRLLRYYPDDVGVWGNLGSAYREQKQFQSAINCFQKILNITPDHVATQSNLAVVLKELGRVSQAVALHQQVIAIEPNNPRFLLNCAASLRESGDFAGALAMFKQAKTLLPEDKKINWDIAQNLLSLGHYREGLKAYESRWSLGELRVQHYSCPLWLGALQQPLIPDRELQGKTILIHAEQGYGDAILAARYLPLLKQKVGRNGTVMLQCDKALHRLFRQVGADQLMSFEQSIKAGDVDYHCPMMSLMGAFDTTPNNIPPPATLHIPPEARAKFAHMRSRTSTQAAHPIINIGIVWRGSDLFKKNNQRSLALTHFLPLAEHPRVRLVSLQKGDPVKELYETGADAYIDDIGSQCDDFADTAAAIDNLDGVIMTDSSVAHVAGSLGKRVINLLHDTPYWIYMLNIATGKTPWYPSMELAHKNSHMLSLIMNSPNTGV